MRVGSVAANRRRFVVPVRPHNLDLAPADNIPVVTTLGRGATAVTGIASSAGWNREKRIGIAETAPGAPSLQTTSADLDLFSTRFRYPGLPSAIPTGGQPGRYVTSSGKPGNVNAKWSFTVDTIHTGSVMEIAVNNAVVSGEAGVILVDGKRVQELPFRMDAARGAGSGTGIMLTFPSSKTRRVQVAFLNQGEGRFGGIAVGPGESVVIPPEQGYTVAVLGDSWVSGDQYVNRSLNAAFQIGLGLGAQSYMEAGMDATGFIRINGTDVNTKFIGRVPAVLAQNPNELIVLGGRFDDIYAAADIQVAVEAFLDSVASIPTVRLISNAADGSANVRDSMRNACLNKGRQYVDMPLASTYTMGANAVLLADAAEHKKYAKDALAKMGVVVP